MVRFLKKQARRIPIPAVAILAVLATAGTPRAGEESLSYTAAIPPVKSAVAAWGRDPFLLPAATQAAGPALKLKAIFFNDENPSAIIDNLIVYRGGEIKGHKVIDIGRTHVILHGEYGRVRLDLSGTTELRDAIR